MALGRLFLCALVVVLTVAPAHAGRNDPFPLGYGMGNLGTIVWCDGISGRQPWTPAAVLGDTLHFGVAAATVSYYDDMDNLTDASIAQFSAGGFARFEAIFLTVKAAYARLSALGIYYEDEGRLSLATDALPFVRVGLEAAGYRAGLLTDRHESETMVRLGESVWIPWSFAALSLTCMHLDIGQGAREVGTPPPTISVGFHTTHHRYGAQGVVLDVSMDDDPKINVRIGEEYWLHPTFGLSFAVAANPFMISFGLVVARPTWSVGGALVHHPVLGWSKGGSGEWAR